MYVTKEDIIFFLQGLQNGNINDIRYKKMLINVLIDKIYLYDDNVTIIFNTNKTSKTTKIDLKEIKEIECSFLEQQGEPIKDSR